MSATGALISLILGITAIAVLAFSIGWKLDSRKMKTDVWRDEQGKFHVRASGDSCQWSAVAFVVVLLMIIFAGAHFVPIINSLPF